MGDLHLLRNLAQLHWMVNIFACSHIALQVVDLPGLNHIIGVRQACPLVQVSSVVEVVHLLLAFLSQFDRQHVYWEVVLGFGLVIFLFIFIVTGNIGYMGSQHEQWVIFNAQSTNMMAALLPETSLVFVLKTQNISISFFYT